MELTPHETASEPMLVNCGETDRMKSTMSLTVRKDRRSTSPPSRRSTCSWSSPNPSAMAKAKSRTSRESSSTGDGSPDPSSKSGASSGISSDPVSSGLMEIMRSLTTTRISSREVGFKMYSKVGDSSLCLYDTHSVAYPCRLSTFCLSGSHSICCGVLPYVHSDHASSVRCAGGLGCTPTRHDVIASLIRSVTSASASMNMVTFPKILLDCRRIRCLRAAVPLAVVVALTGRRGDAIVLDRIRSGHGARFQRQKGAQAGKRGSGWLVALRDRSRGGRGCSGGSDCAAEWWG